MRVRCVLEPEDKQFGGSRSWLSGTEQEGVERSKRASRWRDVN